MERRRKQKILCDQLHVLRLMLEFLEQADDNNWEEEIFSEGLKAEQAKQNWKTLKAAYQDKIQDAESTLPQLLQRLQSLKEKKWLLEESLQRYQSQKTTADTLMKNKVSQKHQCLQDVVQSQTLVVEKCQVHICQLQGELTSLEQSVSSWMQTVSRDSELQTLLQTLQAFSLESVGDNQLVLDLHVGDKEEIAPLRVTLKWTPQGDLQIKGDGSVPAIPRELQDGAISDVRVILQLQDWYRGQARLLMELGALQERFAADWLPDERLLRFLKGSAQFTLHVTPGYPHSGAVQLVSMKGVRPGIDPGTCKPPVETPSLTDWLEYLDSTGVIAD
ncbi:outer kinetochore KNL1 complex subunit ZWINT isoform 2-T2 [Discoglossus pictus]